MVRTDPPPLHKQLGFVSLVGETVAWALYAVCSFHGLFLYLPSNPFPLRMSLFIQDTAVSHEELMYG